MEPLNLSSELGLDRLPEAERAHILAEIEENVFEAALARATEGLGEAEALELMEKISRLPDSAGTQEVRALLRKNMPDFDRILAEELAAFRLDAVTTLRED